MLNIRKFRCINELCIAEKDRERSRKIENDREKEKEREEITINVIKLRHVIQR